MKRKAAISVPVIVTAFERLLRATQEQRSRRHKVARTAIFGTGSVLEAAGQHDGDGNAGVLFFERAIATA